MDATTPASTAASATPGRYRFGLFEADLAAGELRRQGMRIKLHAQPFALLGMLLARPNEVLTREDICRELWPDGTFVDYEHGVNSAVNRLREALGDKAANPRFVETVARRGYRFVAPVERLDASLKAPVADEAGDAVPLADARGPHSEAVTAGVLAAMLSQPEDLPTASSRVVQTLFLLLQLMYLGFYVGALGNLGEISQLLSELPHPAAIYFVLVATAAMMIPMRAFLLSAVLMRAPRLRGKYLRLWPVLLLADALWSLSPFLLLNHINFGLALACTALLLYAPFAQRSLMLMLTREPAIPTAQQPK
ncbi:winged helix-turn-helix domain-containing protein [Bryocella elongata]|nr:winged helix-turn-helix domain-containing protein [Bryocella elongata]